MSLLDTIKQRAYAANFDGGGIYLDSGDVSELNQILQSFTDFTDNLDSLHGEFEDDFEEHEKDIAEAERLLGISYRLIAANEKKLPEHFRCVFTESLDAVGKQIAEFNKSNSAMSEIAGRMNTEIYTNGLHG